MFAVQHTQEKKTWLGMNHIFDFNVCSTREYYAIVWKKGA